MSTINRLVDRVICLLVFVNLIIWSLIIWVDQFGSPADIQTMVWAIQTKAWAIWDASLPVALSLFKILFLVGLSIVVAMFLNAITEGEAARNNQADDHDDYDDGRDYWESYDEPDRGPGLIDYGVGFLEGCFLSHRGR